MRRTLALVAVIAFATGCAQRPTADAAALPTESAVPSAPGPSPSPLVMSREAAVYAQVLRRYLSSPGENSFPETSFRNVFVLDKAYPRAADAFGDLGTGRAIAEQTRAGVAEALVGIATVSFIADEESVIDKSGGCAKVRDGGIRVRLGVIDGDGDEVKVGVNGFVACLGATWLTYVVRRDPAAGWQVTGTTGPMAIS